MKIILILLTAFAAVFLLFACKTTKFKPDNLPDKQLRWGSGGGVVGKETSYTLLENGQIFTSNMGASLAEIAGTKGKRAKELYKMAEALGLAQLDFQHPGNTYDFIEILDGDMVRRISWGDKSYPIDSKIKEFYNQLNQLLKK